MLWDDLYPIVHEQAYYAVLRYDTRRKDKIQELICQPYEKYIRDIAADKPIKKQDYKCLERLVCKMNISILTFQMTS